MKMTIYVPDDLAEQVKEHADLNVSAISQQALRRELARREAMAELDKGMKPVRIYLDDPGYEAMFIGKELHHDYGRQEYIVYLTERHRLAIYDPDAQALRQFDDFDDLAEDPVWRDGHSELVAAVADALGEEHVVKLDI